MRAINTAEEMLAAFEGNRFDLEKWKRYMDASVPGAKAMCLGDMQSCLSAGFSWEKDYLPVLNAVRQNVEKRMEAVDSFRAVAERLDETILGRFGRTVDADVVLYLGLCNGAGWVADVGGRTAILLGIEKIMELDWCGRDAMIGLIVHELGHVYQFQYGTARGECRGLPDQFLWQLFAEGVAMVFEQEIVGDSEYFHQDAHGWKAWCDRNAERIKASFAVDIHHMTREDQRYFGDWVRFDGHGDTGYYLGARFVRFLLKSEDFDRVIQYGVDEVRRGFHLFVQSA